jgi:plastocyanin
MTRWLRLLAAVLSLSLVLAACGDDDGGDSGGTEAADDGGSDQPADDYGGGSGEAECDADVCASGSQFAPAEVSISAGEDVTWTNLDSIEHTVTADDGAVDSGELAEGDGFDFTFESSGEFGFHCEIHPSMTGTVSVS